MRRHLPASSALVTIPGQALRPSGRRQMAGSGSWRTGQPRELAQKNAGCWLATLFDYGQPIIFLTPAEQRLLTCALREWTDDEIAKGLAISTSAVKKCWQSIYTRVGLRLPTLLPEDDDGGKRGVEKKRHLLSYVRNHPEKLRPLLLKAQ
jgi:DNA-binding NarL/FixJ family response regulator